MAIGQGSAPRQAFNQTPVPPELPFVGAFPPYNAAPNNTQQAWDNYPYLKEGTDPDHVASMERDIEEVDRLVGTLLESTRLERGGWVLEKAPGRLATIVSRAADGLELGGRKLDVEVPEDIELDADASRLGRVFKNLFTNNKNNFCQ